MGYTALGPSFLFGHSETAGYRLIVVREVHEALSGKRTGYTTVLKQMQLMAEKGLLVRNERYRSHVYETRLAKEQTQQQLSSQRVSSSELAEIRRMLDELEKGSK